MKTGNIILIILGVILLASVYGFVLYELDYGAVDYDEYQLGTYEGACEFKQLDDGFVQLPNCVKYKLKETPKYWIRISEVKE